MAEPGEIFDGKASQHYIKHHVQNWTAQPFVRGSYSYNTWDHPDAMNLLKTPIKHKIYLAGEAFAESATSTVHGAGFSGIETAKAMMTS